MIRILCTDVSVADEEIYRRLYEKASAERKHKADRYLRYEDKLRCVTADALLRTVLGTNEFQIEKNKYGKPYIKNKKDFYYNLSHSGKYVVIAFGNSEVGIDIQQHLADIDMARIADRFFSEEERKYTGQSDRQMTERFYEIWTGKESYLKYLGKGLCMDMCSFSILEQKRKLHFLKLEEGYTLSLYTADQEYTFELSDIRQLS